jgi:DNA invertase Pin-like site-specific DNA recombinase
MRAIGYARVSTVEQGVSGLGMEAQRRTIEAEATRRGWQPVCLHEDIASGRSLDRRPALAAALTALDRGDADVLVVAKLDRLSRSLADFASLMVRARKHRWAVVALDLGADTTTPAGELVANVIASAAQYERSLVSERTRSALAEKRAQGHKLGRPVSLASEVRDRISSERQAGRTFAAIASALNAERVPTAHGGVKWYPSTVRAVLESRKLDRVASGSEAA